MFAIEINLTIFSIRIILPKEEVVFLQLNSDNRLTSHPCDLRNSDKISFKVIL